MENNPSHHEEGACCGGICKCCKCFKHPIVRIIFKIVFILIIVALICLAFSRGFHHGRFGNEMKFGGCGMMNSQTVPAVTCAGAGMMGFEKGVWGEEKEGKDMAKLFGVITKVEGNKITVLDNGAKEQTFLSQPETTIMTSAGEVGLSALKAGQNVILMQGKGEDKQLKLELVQVL